MAGWLGKCRAVLGVRSDGGTRAVRQESLRRGAWGGLESEAGQGRRPGGGLGPLVGRDRWGA